MKRSFTSSGELIVKSFQMAKAVDGLDDALAVLQEDSEEVVSDTLVPGDHPVILEQTEEIVATTEDTAIIEGEEQYLEETSIITQIMDIRQPLSKLKMLLEEKLRIELTDYQFWLQDAQILESHKNLVDQCVQGEGLVQINVEIKEEGDLKKINIMDVLKPSDDLAAISQALNQPESEVNQKMTPVSEPQQVMTRWVVDPHFRKDQERLKIPLDPQEWSSTHVKHWIQWAVRQFNLVGIILSDWDITGEQLCEMTPTEFKAKVPQDDGDLFITHVEILRTCKHVAVIQKPQPLVQYDSSSQLSAKIHKPGKTKVSRIGIPKITDLTPATGNRTGNNGQIQLWQFLLELLTDKKHRNEIQWIGNDGEFKLNNPEMVAQLWGHRKNKPNMNYEKLSRALRYYYDGDMIAKVHGKRFVYRFVCNLKDLMGYSAQQLNNLVQESEQRHLQKMRNGRLKIYSDPVRVLDSEGMDPLRLEAS